MHILNDWPDDERSNQMQAQMERDREQMQQEIEEAWGRLMIDRKAATLASNYGDLSHSSEDDIKLLKWALGIK